MSDFCNTHGPQEFNKGSINGHKPGSGRAFKRSTMRKAGLVP
jgi:hypothetical protein